MGCVKFQPLKESIPYIFVKEPICSFYFKTLVKVASYWSPNMMLTMEKAEKKRDHFIEGWRIIHRLLNPGPLALGISRLIKKIEIRP